VIYAIIFIALLCAMAGLARIPFIQVLLTTLAQVRPNISKMRLSASGGVNGRRSLTLMIPLLAVAFSTAGLCPPASAQMGVPVFGQRWDPWQWDRLGYSSYLIRDAGCAVTSTAMVLNYYGAGTNPRDLNGWLKARGGFYGAAIIWSAAAGRAPNLRWIGSYDWTYVPANLGVVNAWLDSGRPLIAETRLGGRQHFVVLTGRSGYVYFINDPWFGDRTTFNSRYGDPARWIYGIRIYSR
jgi:hypothetical protein